MLLLFRGESIDHLFFTCPVAKVAWGIVGLGFGQTNIPGNLEQYKSWVRIWLPRGTPVYSFGLAAICWAIWKSRNRACFDKKTVEAPC